MNFESAASAALKVLQAQVKDLKDQNQQLQSKLHHSQNVYVDDKRIWEQEMERSNHLYLSREQEMVSQIHMMSDKIKLLENSYKKSEDENKDLKSQIKSGAEKDGIIEIFKEEIRQAKKQIQAKEQEHELLSKRIHQLESERRNLDGDHVHQVNYNDSLDYSKTEISRPNTVYYSTDAPDIEQEANRIERELESLKIEYRSTRSGSYIYDSEWRRTMENIMKQIEIKSLSLLDLRSKQRKILSSSFD